MSNPWKPARGRIGAMAPLIGRWKAVADSPMGRVTCIRDYQPFGEHFVRLDAEWLVSGQSDAGKAYREVCVFGPDKDGNLAFWSYSNDGKKSSGRLVDGSDIHPEAVCFEARMEDGLARQVFSPDDRGGMHWVVESHNRNGWNRLVQHHYRPA